MNYSFEEIFDIPTLTSLCESFTRINGTVTALLDLDGKVHISTGWQDLCTQFHRLNPETSQRCTESDTVLAAQSSAGKPYNLYKCKNGLVDVAIPVIVEGEHVGNFFTGQFLLEKPDKNYFRKQAREFGINEIPYMKSLDEVPIFTEEQVKKSMDFLVNLTQVVGEMGLQKLRIMNQEKERRNLLEQEVALRTKELGIAMKRLEVLASQDSLTELDNRRQFNECFKEAFNQAKRHKALLSVAMIDVDKFKAVNDKHGHSAGDSVLVQVAKELKSNTRTTDIVARVGGEEFCMVFSGMREHEVLSRLEKIRKNLADIVHQGKSETFSVTCSFGVSHLSSDIENEEVLLSHADNALYQAKETGRNKIVQHQKSH